MAGGDAGVLPVNVRVLGPVDVVGASGPVAVSGRLQLRLLAALTARVGRAVAADALIDELWGDRPPDTATTALQMHVSRLRKTLERAGTGAAVIRTDPAGYTLALPRSAVDAARFEDLVSQAREAEGAEAAAAAWEALDLWRGDHAFEAVAGDGAGGLVDGAAVRLHELRLSALDLWAAASLDAGRHAEVAAELESWVEKHPLREDLRARLITALYRSNRQADALRHCESLRRALRDELGISPGPEVRELESLILTQDPSLRGPAPPQTRRRAPETPFVGRRTELADALALLADAQAGTGRVLVASGEPGIGKTRLAEEVAGSAAASGMDVAWGRSYESETPPPLWPWSQVLRSLAGAWGTDAFAALAADDMAELASLVRDDADAAGAEHADPEAARFRLFNAVSRLIGRAAARRPLAVVLDDVQWADPASLRLLRHVAAESADSALLLVVLFRDVDATPNETLRDVVAQLARLPGTTRRVLGGLAEDEVGEFVQAVTGDEAPAAVLSGSLHAKTGGNPFFVGEVLKLLQAEGRLDAGAAAVDAVDAVDAVVPVAVQEVIERRVARLSDDARDVLATAAVAGRQFDVSVVAAAAGYSLEAAVGLLDEAVRAGLVSDDTDAIGCLRFTHDLVRDAVSAPLTRMRQALIHARTAEAMDGLGASGERAAALAEHALRGVAGGFDARRAAVLAVKAAEYATALRAYEDAVALCERALDAYEAASADDAEVKCRVLLALGEGRWRVGDVPGARSAFLDAADVADAAGNAELLAAAVLGFGGGVVRDWHATRGAFGERVVELLEKALDRVGPADSPLRVRLLGHLAEELYYSDDERRYRLSAEALAMAHRLGEPATVAFAMCSRCLAVWDPHHLDERLSLAADIVAAAQAAGDRELELFGRHYLFVAQLEACEVEAAMETLGAFEAAAEELGQPLYLWEGKWFRAVEALLRGDFDRAERLATEAFEIGERTGDPDALSIFGVQLGIVRLEQGRAAEVDAAVAAFASEFEESPSWQAAVALLHLELGRAEEARAVFDRLAHDRFKAIPHDFAYLAALVMLSEVCVGLADAEHAAVLVELLTPFAERNALTADRNCWGATSRSLGTLATLLGRYDEAERRLTHARASNEAMGARPWAAHACHDLAAALARRAADGDGARAAALLDDAERQAADMGMTRLVRRVAATRQLLDESGAVEPQSRD